MKSTSLKPKAQVFSFDFMLATSIFLIIFIVVYMYWTYTSAQIQETQYFNDMVDKAFLISEAWFREGVPVDWDSSNFIELGLQSDHKLNETKMNYLNDLGYKKVKDSIGVQPYEFFYKISFPGGIVLEPPIVYFVSQVSQRKLDVDLNESGIIWDYYWATTGEDPPNPNTVTARKFYNGTNVNLMFKMISELDKYNSVIMEYPSLNWNAIQNEPENITKFQNWVKNGGVLFFIGTQPRFLKTFDLHPDGNPQDKFGTVVDLDPVLIGKESGDTITYRADRLTFDAPNSPNKTITEITGNPNYCNFCRWYYGDGSIYYASDSSDDTNTRIASIRPLGYYYTFGKYPVDPDYVLKVERFGILNSSLAKIEVILWV